MFIRAYLRASTDEQDAGRARDSLERFVQDQNKAIACEYIENASGAASDRPELLRLLKDARKGTFCWWSPLIVYPVFLSTIGTNSRQP